MWQHFSWTGWCCVYAEINTLLTRKAIFLMNVMVLCSRKEIGAQFTCVATFLMNERILCSRERLDHCLYMWQHFSWTGWCCDHTEKLTYSLHVWQHFSWKEWCCEISAQLTRVAKFLVNGMVLFLKCPNSVVYEHTLQSYLCWSVLWPMITAKTWIRISHESSSGRAFAKMQNLDVDIWQL